MDQSQKRNIVGKSAAKLIKKMVDGIVFKKEKKSQQIHSKLCFLPMEGSFSFR